MKLGFTTTVNTSRIGPTIAGVSRAMGSAVWAGAQATLLEARRRVATRTGELAASLRVIGVEGQEHLEVGSFGAVHGGRAVAHYVEDGTHKMHARPFMRPAAQVGRMVYKLQAEARVRAAAG